MECAMKTIMFILFTLIHFKEHGKRFTIVTLHITTALVKKKDPSYLGFVSHYLHCHISADWYGIYTLYNTAASSLHNFIHDPA